MAAKLNMKNAKVTHCKYGKGVIKETKGNHLTIRFETTEEDKVFTYPDAFEKFLKFEAAELQEMFAKDWKEHILVSALEEKRRQQEYQRLENEKKREMIALMKKRQKAALAKAERERKQREKYAKMIS